MSAEPEHEKWDKGKFSAQAIEFLIRVVLCPMVGFWIDVCYLYHSAILIVFFSSQIFEELQTL